MFLFYKWTNNCILLPPTINYQFYRRVINFKILTYVPFILVYEDASIDDFVYCQYFTIWGIENSCRYRENF